MKAITLTLFICVVSFLAIAQKASRNDAFDRAIKQVLLAFETQNDSLVNTMIHQELHLDILYREGASDRKLNISSLSFREKNYPLNQLSQYGAQYTIVKHQIAPFYNCDLMSYPKNTAGIYVQLISDESSTERATYHISAIDNNGAYIIFNLIKLSGKYYLSSIDMLSNDCSS